MTQRSRRIPAASLFLRQASGPRAVPQTEDEMAVTEIIEDEAEQEPLPIRVRLANLRDYEELCGLFDRLDELHREARPTCSRPSRRRRARASRSPNGWRSPIRQCWSHRARRGSWASQCC